MSTEAVDRSSILNVNVGILGHVDAGKTSLVRSLSTSLSTAALDKNPQSQQRGITLDLGFSSFTLPMPAHLATDPNIAQYEHIQFTLVDCPGHASLIRTIIGGAQIIDMILLVVDANKGIQTQTAECIVIGEITTDNMIIVLNKVDTIPEADREAKIERVSNRIRKVFASTKFAGVPIVATAASVGGEKTIGAGAQTQKSAALPPSEGIEDLLNLIKQKVVIPARNYNAPFYYAIDHCFSIKGHGTVLTGTVLSGSVSTNSIIEIPHLQITRKVKSLQMFRKPVKSARQGDRVGICVTNLDASLIERSIACAPSTVPLLQSVLCLVKKVRFFRHACKSLSKFHVSIGHETVVATAVFFGSSQLAQYVNATGKDPTADSTAINHSNSSTVKQSALNATYHKSFPAVDFDFYDPDGSTTAVSKSESVKPPSQHQHQHQHHGYEYQEEMLSAEGLAYNTEPLQWALLQFQHSVFCPIGSLIIGSRLDTDTSDHPGSSNNNNNSSGGGSTGKEKEGGVPSAAQQCRLAFFGPVKASLGGVADLPRTGVYSWKCKECEVFLLTDVTTSNTAATTPKCNNKATHHSSNSISTNSTQKNLAHKDTLVHEIVVWKLITGGGAVTPFLGMQVETLDKRITGTVVSSYGADGKVRVKFSTGVRGLTVGSKLLFRYKKYLFDKSKKMDQSGLDELRAEEAVLRVDSEEKVEDTSADCGDNDCGDDRERSNAEDAGILLGTPTEAVRVEDSILESHGNGSVWSAEVSTVMPDTSAGTASLLPPPLLPELSPEETMATPTISASTPTPTSIVRITFTPLSTLLSQIAVTNPSNDNNNTASIDNTSIPPIQTTSNTTTAASTASVSVSDIHYPAGTSAETHLVREGTIESVKIEDTSEIVTVKGAFRMEENIRLHIGAVAVSSISNNNFDAVGSVVGPFGKMGKCKVKFEVGQAGNVGYTVSIFTLK